MVETSSLLNVLAMEFQGVVGLLKNSEGFRFKTTLRIISSSSSSPPPPPL